MSLINLLKDPDIYNIKIPLRNNPLRDLNVYVIVDSGEALVIDTGFRQEECYEGLTKGLKELIDMGIPMNKMQLFLTHMHSDHAGQMDLFAKEGCPVYINEKDLSLLKKSISGEGRKYVTPIFLENGYPAELLERANLRNPMFAYASLSEVKLTTIQDGTVLKVGNLSIRCVETGGHTPGHTCLYLEEAGILFSGDHVLYDISPNIGIWEGVDDSLGDYLESLKKVDALEFHTAYPAHRELHDHPHDRIHALMQHHKARLEEVMEIVCGTPGMTAYWVTSKMKWSIRCKSWDDFPEMQKWFATCEALAHLDWLERRNYIEYRREEDGLIHIYPKEVRDI